jgi:hypothetical protein
MTTFVSGDATTSSAGTDGGSGDTGDGDTGDGDTGDGDGDTGDGDGDGTGDGDGDGDGTGGLGDPCTDDDDCMPGVCIDSPNFPGNLVCAVPCDPSCPEGFACNPVSFGGTQVLMCVQAADNLCSICDVNADCGDVTDYCIQLTAGEFCVIDCEADPTICPQGFSCALVPGSDAITTFQCVPSNGICCLDGDGDLHGVGDGCAGLDCDDTDPDRFVGNPEVCDGIDNDCNNMIDDDPTDCQASECNLGMLGYFEQPGEVCDSVAGMCVAGSSMLCDLYTCEGGADSGDACATACQGEADTLCIPSAHCDADVCFSDLPNGSVCDEDSDCISSHCQGGFCCDNGDCCAMDSDCPGGGSMGAICDDPATCQGTSGLVVCSGLFQCTTSSGSNDDTACDPTVEANECGPYVSIFCDGTASQTPPQCPSTCLSHADCDPEAYCDPGSNTCEWDLSNGNACGDTSDDDEWCVSDYCSNGFCCDGPTGDCCNNESDCPPSYTGTPMCDTPATCQGSALGPVCIGSTCTSMALDNDTACDGASGPAQLCGAYPDITCNGAPTQVDPPVCATTCANDSQCDVTAYCATGSVCVPDGVNGDPCNDDAECTSNYCNNGFCCDSGLCCANDGDCDSLDTSSVCDTPATCTGSRSDGTCDLVTKQCSASITSDDTGCSGGFEADDCGPYPSIFCDGTTNQNPPGCATSCVNDQDCDAGAFCNAQDQCETDGGVGSPCGSAAECQGTLGCVDGVCCSSACTGLCQACDVVGSEGTCTPVPDGLDPDGECNGLSCSSYYDGWGGSNLDACYAKADLDASAHSCNGAGQCATAAEACPGRGPAAIPTIDCDDFCESKDGATCTGQSTGVCNIENPGNTTCGFGICENTQALCDGAGNQVPCSPLNNSTTETCNDLDDDCNDAVDDGLFQDASEPINEGCPGFSLLGVGSDETEVVSTNNIFPSGDEDVFHVRMTESTGGCTCGNGTDEDYRITVQLDVPPGAGNYELCMDVQAATGLCSQASWNCSTVFAGSSGAVLEVADGGCPQVDSYDVYIRVRGTGVPGFECEPYTLTYTLDDGFCDPSN